MGLTPLEGLVMGTRSGDVDPGVILHLMNRFGMSAGEVDTFLNKESGLKGLSGLESGDVRVLNDAAANGNRRAQLALKIFCYRVKKYIGAYVAAMGGLDVLVFTAGIGENAVQLREDISAGLEFLGVELDKGRNNTAEPEKFINADNSKVKILVVPTNEELLIARDTVQVVGHALEGC
jgi:acetate kinase